ncbi:MAG TPA: hypothetical protein VM618_04595 [Acidimicrobiia bacterium]|jgi:hypothetical protein|nr:hypothetical protein [Acidimicrobiia bacterium]
MAKRRTTYGKLERDRAKKAKAAAKRERRQDRSATDEEFEPESERPATPAMPEDEVLDRLSRIHQQFDDGEISFDEFEEAKANLLEHLDVS